MFESMANFFGFGNSDQVDEAQKYISQNKELWNDNYKENQDILKKYLNATTGLHDDTLKSQFDKAKYDFANQGAYKPSTFRI